MQQHIVVVRRLTTTTHVGPFDSYNKADEYRNELVKQHRIDEEEGRHTIKGTVAHYVSTMIEPNPEVLKPPKPTCFFCRKEW